MGRLWGSLGVGDAALVRDSEEVVLAAVEPFFFFFGILSVEMAEFAAEILRLRVVEAFGMMSFVMECDCALVVTRWALWKLISRPWGCLQI